LTRENSTSLLDVERPSRQYPRGVGTKFTADGAVMPFPGNTIICHLPGDSPLKPGLLDLYKTLEEGEHRHLYTLLPPESWHMTVFEGVVDAKREIGFWPDDLQPNIPLDECTSHFAQKLDRFDLEGLEVIGMDVTGWLPLVDGIGLTLTSKQLAQETELRRLRDRLSDALQLRNPEHDHYVFHLSIAYLLKKLTPAQSEALAATLQHALASLPSGFMLRAPEFCEFDDMFEFRRKFYLRTAV